MVKYLSGTRHDVTNPQSLLSTPLMTFHHAMFLGMSFSLFLVIWGFSEGFKVSYSWFEKYFDLNRCNTLSSLVPNNFVEFRTQSQAHVKDEKLTKNEVNKEIFIWYVPHAYWSSQRRIFSLVHAPRPYCEGIFFFFVVFTLCAPHMLCAKICPFKVSLHPYITLEDIRGDTTNL